MGHHCESGYPVTPTDEAGHDELKRSRLGLTGLLHITAATCHRSVPVSYRQSCWYSGMLQHPEVVHLSWPRSGRTTLIADPTLTNASRMAS